MLPRPAREALQHPQIRRIEVAWGLSTVSTMTATVALLVYAYAAGGATLVAVYGVLATVPAALVTPVLLSLADRVAKDRLLRYTTGLRAVLLGGASVAVAVGAPSAVVIALAVAAASLAPCFRPIQAVALPWLARTPAELTAATVTATLAENLGVLVGPLLAGGVLALAGQATAIAVSAGCAALAVACLLRVVVPEDRTEAAGPGLRHALGEVARGAAVLVRVARPGGVVVLVFLQTFVRGALLVLIIVLALKELALDDASVGWLNAAIGLGGIIGSALSVSVMRMTRLGRCFTAAIGLWGVGVLALSGAPTAAAAFGALLLGGIGNAMEDASIFVLVPRLAGPRMAGRTMGALELVILAGTGAGSIAAPLLNGWLGLRPTLLLLGGVLLAGSVGYAVRFAAIDRGLLPPRAEVELLRNLPMFAALPLVTIEQLAGALEIRVYDDGAVVMRAGEAGDRFYLITSGTARVTVHDHDLPALGPGDGFGEIALLRDVPRTATVTADGPLSTLSLDREDFLGAISRTPASARHAELLAERRLAAG
jgi:hypothetical protein